MKLTDRRQAGKRKEQLSYAKNLVKDRKGTTLVETMVTLFLISILMAMAASALSSASRIFVRIQKTQYAQSVLDTTMTELRTITKDATGYVKLYERTTAMDEQYGGSKGTNTKGNAIEFMTPEGFVELVSANGCSETEIHIGDKVTGTADAVETGQLLTRYYFRNSNTGQYIFTQNGKPVARAVANVFAKGFYMGNYVEVEYSYPANVSDGSKISSITAKVTVYSEYDKATKSLKNVMATDTEVLEFRNPITVKGNADSAITAIKQKSIVEKKIVKQKAELVDASQGFYDLLENQQVDELVTGIALKHNLKPVYLKIEGTEAGVPAAYQTVTQTDESGAQTAKSAQEELDENNQESSSDTDYEPEVVLQYVNTTTVSMTLQGNESQIREMLDDIAKNYPGVQVRSFDMNENTYVDSSLQQISQNNCECVLAVYTCGQLGTTASGEEN